MPSQSVRQRAVFDRLSRQTGPLIIFIIIIIIIIFIGRAVGQVGGQVGGQPGGWLGGQATITTIRIGEQTRTKKNVNAGEGHPSLFLRSGQTNSVFLMWFFAMQVILQTELKRPLRR